MNNYTQNELKKTKLNSEIIREKELEESIEENDKNLSKVRKIMLTTTGVTFFIHFFGLILSSPPVIISALLTLLITTLAFSPKFFKLYDKEETLKNDLEVCQKLIKELKEELRQNHEEKKTEYVTVPTKSENRTKSKPR